MSERSERLFEALSEIDEKKIDEASPEGRTNRFHWKKWGAIAAALILVVGIGSQILPRLGGGSGSGGNGANGASTFMSYAGPVFPLTLREADGAITAERELTLDFAPWVPVWWSNEEEADSRVNLTPERRREVLANYNEWYPEGGRWRSSSDIQVTDAYTLTNTSTEDKTVSVLYPFASELQEVWRNQPTLTADGQTLETALHAGPFAGGFSGAGGSEQRWNLSGPNSWEEYKAVLSDGSYQAQALGEYPDLSDIPVTVYRLSDPWVKDAEQQTAPAVRISFELDFERTKILFYGFNSFWQDIEAGQMALGFFLSEAESNQRYGGAAGIVIVFGDDITNITTQGSHNLAWEEKENWREGDVTIQRKETDLDSALRDVTRMKYNFFSEYYKYDNSWNLSAVDYEMYHGLFCERLVSDGMLSDDPVERYTDGMIEDLDVAGVMRVFYLEGAVTIPAGGSVTLTADLHKNPSYDFYCAHAENQGVSGYDMVTKLGSNLACPVQTAVLEDRGQIEIVRQNFGFDLEQGITEVTLDPEQEHYYLEVRRLPDEE